MLSFFKKNLIFLGLLFVLGSFFLAGFEHLGKFITADESYWVYERIPQYWNAVTEQKWKKTFINDKPGVSLALVSGIALLPFPDPALLCSRTEEKIITCNTEKTEQMLFTFRIFILSINTLLLLYLFWIIKKLTNNFLAFWSVFFMAFSPILVGISQIINPDALLWSFGSATTFSFFALLRFQEKKYIFLSGFFLGMTILSKYTGSILIPFFLLSTFLFSLSSTKENTLDSLKKLRKNLLSFLFSFLFAVITIIFFLPAIWLKPLILQNLLSGGSETPFLYITLFFFLLSFIDAFFLRGRFFFFFCKIIQYLKKKKFSLLLLSYSLFLLSIILILGRIFFPHWDIFALIPFDSKDLTTSYSGITPNILESFFLELNPLLFSLTPVTLLFFLIALVFSSSDEKYISLIKIFCVLFVPSFLILLIAFDVLGTPRYSILLCPFVAFLSAYGLWKTFFFLKERIFFTPAKIFISISFILAFSFVHLFLSAPFYFNYTNFLLPQKYLISDAWGYGGYESAQYLNSLPNANDLLVWTDYDGVCEFFIGKCMLRQYKYSAKQNFDYAVLTRRGKILYDPNHIRWIKEDNLSMKEAYDNPVPDWQLLINDRPENFVRVVKLQKWPIDNK